MGFARERYACMSCPAFYECTDSQVNATAGGYEDREIDGKKYVCCIPAHFIGNRKPMQQYAFYCTASGRAKKIAGKADYTGNVPVWCPRLKA